MIAGQNECCWRVTNVNSSPSVATATNQSSSFFSILGVLKCVDVAAGMKMVSLTGPIREGRVSKIEVGGGINHSAEAFRYFEQTSMLRAQTAMNRIAFDKTESC